MQISKKDQKLLALHYVFPVPLNRLERLLDEDPMLDYLYEYNAQQLAQLLSISMTKASQLQQSLLLHRFTPYESLYQQHSIFPIPYTHFLYPRKLHHLIDPPTVLYAKGKLTLLQAEHAVAVIGSRKASSYTKLALTQLLPPLVKENIVIISGLAKGADTMAHQSTINYGGKTIGVLGHGFFHMYPKENTKIASEMAQHQLILTEYPPYVLPAKWTFPMRNRIISGLANAVVVTEATEKSGTMSTVEHALDHGKEIFVVPGSIQSSLSLGPHKLLEEGAKPVWNGFQIIESLQK